MLDIMFVFKIVPVNSLLVLGPISGIIRKGPSGTLYFANVDPISFFLNAVSPLSKS